MPIGGFVRTSFVDYPGKIATTVFLTNCNFYCPFCQNPELVLDSVPSRVDFDQVLDFIKEARHMVDAICFSGGEPTLDPQLPEYIAKAKELGLLIKLDSNGGNPDILKKLSIDYIAMDLKTSPDKYALITKIPDITDKIKQSVNIIMHELNVGYEFRTTLAPGFADEQDIREIGKLITTAPKWYLQKFRNTNCLDRSYQGTPPFTNEKIEQLLSIAKEYIPNASLR